MSISASVPLDIPVPWFQSIDALVSHSGRTGAFLAMAAASDASR